MSNWSKEVVQDYYRARLSLEGDGQAATNCPFHSDHSPSMSIDLESGSWTCHAGCGTGNLGEFENFYLVVKPTASRLLNQTSFIYGDEDGDELYRVRRQDLGGEKNFIAGHYDEQGRWVLGIRGIRRVPYNLHRVKGAELVVIVEGEKCVDAMEGLQLSDELGMQTAATCNPFGAGKWATILNRYLAGKDVIVIPDNDKPGKRHAVDVAKHLQGVARSVKLLEIPGLAEGGDVADFIRTNGASASSRVCELLKQAETLSWDDQPRIELMSMSDVLDGSGEEPEWVVDGLMLHGGLSLIAAKPKAGKSTLARQLAFSVARGTPFLGRATRHGPVLLISLEDQKLIVRAHFLKMGATDSDPITIHFKTLQIADLRWALEETKPILLIVDHLHRLLEVKDSDNYVENMRELTKIRDLCTEYSVHTCVIHHAKKLNTDDPFDSILGSTAIFAGVETALVVARLPEDQNVRTIVSRSRFGRDFDNTVLQFDPATGLSSLGPQVTELKRDSVARRQTDKEERIEQKILRHVELNPGVTEEEIREAVSIKTEELSKTLRKLVGNYQLTRSGSGVKGNPYKYLQSNARATPLAPAA